MGIEYSYAKDSKGRLVHITSAIPGVVYYCPNCGNEMIPKLGEINAHHFAHKVECSCNGESYIHKVAKEKFKEIYDSSKEFILEYPTRIKCSFYDDPKVCPLSTEECDRFEFTPNRYNLKTIFNDCQIEGPVQINDIEFKADILLRDTTGKTDKILLIEFYHTHKCSREKIESGVPIVEVKIEGLSDIISSNIIKFRTQNNYYGFKTTPFGGKILLYCSFEDESEACDLKVERTNCQEISYTNYNDYYECSAAFAVAIDLYSFFEFSSNPKFSKAPPSVGETACAIAYLKGFKTFYNCHVCGNSRRSDYHFMDIWCVASKYDKSIPKNGKKGRMFECKYFIPCKGNRRLKFLLRSIKLLRYEVLRCELPLRISDD